MDDFTIMVCVRNAVTIVLFKILRGKLLSYDGGTPNLLSRQYKGDIAFADVNDDGIKLPYY